MLINSPQDLAGMQKVSSFVANTLRQMTEYAQPGMSTWEVDQFGGTLFKKAGAKSAPYISYGFPGWTCISVNREIAHGVPSKKTILQEGDLVNIDVSAAINGYFADNGGSFILGEDRHNFQPLVEASKRILKKAIEEIKPGSRVNLVGRTVHREAKKAGFTVIHDLCGHGVGRSLHEEPSEIPNFYDRWNRKRFKKDVVVAVETFISTKSKYFDTLDDGWTLVGKKGGFVAQHEHTLIVTAQGPRILTEENGYW
jgi:methionyl aminopeptidase